MDVMLLTRLPMFSRLKGMQTFNEKSVLELQNHEFSGDFCKHKFGVKITFPLPDVCPVLC